MQGIPLCARDCLIIKYILWTWTATRFTSSTMINIKRTLTRWHLVSWSRNNDGSSSVCAYNSTNRLGLFKQNECDNLWQITELSRCNSNCDSLNISCLCSTGAIVLSKPTSVEMTWHLHRATVRRPKIEKAEVERPEGRLQTNPNHNPNHVPNPILNPNPHPNAQLSYLELLGVRPFQLSVLLDGSHFHHSNVEKRLELLKS